MGEHLATLNASVFRFRTAAAVTTTDPALVYLAPAVRATGAVDTRVIAAAHTARVHQHVREGPTVARSLDF
jgi:hypothetical protein